MPAQPIRPVLSAGFDRVAVYTAEPLTVESVLQIAGRSSAWLERYVRDVEVASSNLVAPTCCLAEARWLGKAMGFCIGNPVFVQRN